MRQVRSLLAVAALLLAAGGGVAWYLLKPGRSVDPLPAPLGDPWFEDVTDAWGLDFVHDAGDLNRWDLTQIDGSGVAVLDFDGDGRPDLYFLTLGGSSSKSTNKLYRNTGARFTDVSAGSGVDIAGESTGVAVGDVNNDGKPDLLVAQVGGVRLFLNQGDGKFRDVTREAGLENPLWASSVNFLDYDRDGYLDLVVVNYVQNDPNHHCHTPSGQRTYCGPTAFPGTVSKLFHNRGAAAKDGVQFEDVTIKSGLATAPAPGLAVYCADWTGDGWPDILIANDAKANHLWVNQKNGTFKDEAHFRGIATDHFGLPQAGMGIAVGDIDGDGLLDVYMTHLNIEKNTLWLQGPKRGFFADRTAKFSLAGMGWRGTGWGVILRDFDRDGWPDIAIANGAVTVGTPTPNPALGHFAMLAERNQIFRNQGQGQFQDLSESNAPFCGTPNVARSLATGDFDGDGALDIVITTVGNRARVYRNVVKNRGHWVDVRLIDPRLKRDAYGAEATLTAGGRRLVQNLNPGDSYQCSSEPVLHFGLGGAAVYDELRVTWPDGLVERFPGGAADRRMEINRGAGQPVPAASPAP